MNILENIPTYIAIAACYLSGLAILAAIYWLIRYTRFRRKMKWYFQTTGLNPYRVPSGLRSLLPFAKKWGIEDGALRADAYQTATPSERIDLSHAVIGKEDFIQAWLNSIVNQAYTPEASAFLFMIRGLYESGLLIDPVRLTEDFSNKVTPYHYANRVRSIQPQRVFVVRRFFKQLPTLVEFLISATSFVFNFMIWGKTWSILFPHDQSATGLVIVNALSGFLSLLTLILIERLLALRQGR